ncbi:Cro/Cl family transcriptional regulator [Mycobacterium sp. MS1601]|uniref:helix-turn-helix domain-containing protein n=1 Tax=Mycobacterium sp. MS1601 TaxID=1936029 RepID=UPI000979561B|nr:XRE family transcriptional regulator [Mycobacterium sp. MS1601]AQA04396.1 Cro/Cl family transcriptional regulator [Mycobacterium sp. MS1601]
MSGIDSKVLGGRIREARKRADMSQEDLGRIISLERTVVNKIEAGIRKVTALELADIAAAINTNMSTFFDDPVPALVAHRSSQGLDTADSKIDALLANLASEVEFVAAMGVDKELGLSGADVVSQAGVIAPATHSEAETLATLARELMGLTADEAIPTLSASVEKLGLLTFSRDIGKDTADAGTIMLRRGGVAFINSYMKIGRRRLALAHELGHYLIGDNYTIDWRVDHQSCDDVPLESRIDRFARAVLLPESAVVKQWGERLDQFQSARSAAICLASKFRVDMATLATRLRELELIDAETRAEVYKYRTTQTDIIEMNLYVPVEELAATTVPRPFARAVLRLVRDERISRERALQLLQGTVDDVDLPEVRERRPDEMWKFVS